MDNVIAALGALIVRYIAFPPLVCTGRIGADPRGAEFLPVFRRWVARISWRKGKLAAI